MSSEGDQPPAAASIEQTSLLFRGTAARTGLTAAERRKLREFAAGLSHKIAGSAAFTCVITTDRELQRLNNYFLRHDYPTDVLSFPDGGEKGNLGEIAISLERAQAQAREFGHTCLDELRILMLHGVLHLAGFDHERDRGEMARAEHKWRLSFGLPSGLIARSQHRPRTRPLSQSRQGAEAS